MKQNEIITDHIEPVGVKLVGGQRHGEELLSSPSVPFIDCPYWDTEGRLQKEHYKNTGQTVDGFRVFSLEEDWPEIIGA